MKPKPPCKDCKDRKMGCHSKCKSYIEYKQKFNKWQSELKEEKYQNWLFHHSYDRMVSRKKDGHYKNNYTERLKKRV